MMPIQLIGSTTPQNLQATYRSDSDGWRTVSRRWESLSVRLEGLIATMRSGASATCSKTSNKRSATDGASYARP